MSDEAVAYVMNFSKQSGSALLVLILMGNDADSLGVTKYSSLERLAARSRMSYGSCKRLVHKLEKEGDLQNLERGRGRTASVYRLVGVQELFTGTNQRGQVDPPRGVKMTPQRGQDSPPRGVNLTPKKELSISSVSRLNKHWSNTTTTTAPASRPVQIPLNGHAPKPLLDAVRRAPFLLDTSAADRLWRECRAVLPDVSPAAIAQRVQAKWPEVQTARNPIGVLLKAIPAELASDAARYADEYGPLPAAD